MCLEDTPARSTGKSSPYAYLLPAPLALVLLPKDKKSGGPLQGSLPKTSGYERSGDNYAAVFKGLQGGVGL